MRPTKINKKIIKAIDKVASNDINAIIFTDEELVAEANDMLDKEDKFSYSAFKDWKAFATSVKKREDTNEENYEMYMRLRSVIKKALRNQKKHLFEKFRNKEETQWQKWAWIIERKFDDWNLQKKVDVTSKKEKLNLIEFKIVTNDDENQQESSGGDSGSGEEHKSIQQSKDKDNS
ncbi:MAG: hypothetical protein ACOC5T_06870 [Elusimicrobiota bacterium]